jgi:hypothetical protein
MVVLYQVRNKTEVYFNRNIEVFESSSDFFASSQFSNLLSLHTIQTQMFRKFFALLFLLSLGVQCFHKAWVVLSFYWNQSYIASVLCENKAKPEMQCQGTCQLRKQLKKSEQQEKQLPRLKDSTENVWSSTSNYPFVAPFFDEAYAHHYHFSMGVLKQYHPTVFHPPAERC